MKILGYKLNVLGVQSSCKLRGPKGQAIDYKITVLPSLPQLDCIISKKDTTKEPLEKDEMLKLYLGETEVFECTVTNISNIKADNVKISLNTTPYYFKEISELIDNNFESNSDLDPGESKKFELKIQASKLLVNNSVVLTDVDSEGPSSIPLTRLESSRWSGRSTGEPNSASSSSKRPAFVTLDLKISYSGGDGGQKGYCRELGKTLKVDICPSALVSKWDILPSEVVHENYLVLDISNQSIHEMEIEYGPQKKLISIEPLDDCRIPVSVAKFPLKSEDSSLNGRLKACLKHLEDTLHIKWTLPRLNHRHGFVSLREIKLDDQMISSLEICPLEWALTLNGQEPLGDHQNLPLGQEISVKMQVMNRFNCPIRAKLKVEVNLEDSNFPENLMSISQPVSGAMECGPGDTFEHFVSILPLISGAYDVLCSCSVVKLDDLGDKNIIDDNNGCKNQSMKRTDNYCYDYVSQYPKIKLHITDEIA